MGLKRDRSPRQQTSGTAALLTSKTDLETVAALQTLQSFVDKAGQAFLEVHQEQVHEEKSQIHPPKQKKDDLPGE
jgi:hypothetical protein